MYAPAIARLFGLGARLSKVFCVFWVVLFWRGVRPARGGWACQEFRV